VTAEGKLLTASAEDNGDLFWALRGGGGNFGVVTSFQYRLYPVSSVLGGMIVYPRSQAVAVLRFYRSFTQSAPEELTAYAGLLHTPDGKPTVAVVAWQSMPARRCSRRRALAIINMFDRSVLTM
jgi:FAD/FMN-containing dehydrogenase